MCYLIGIREGADTQAHVNRVRVSAFGSATDTGWFPDDERTFGWRSPDGRAVDVTPCLRPGAHDYQAVTLTWRGQLKRTTLKHALEDLPHLVQASNQEGEQELRSRKRWPPRLGSLAAKLWMAQGELDAAMTGLADGEMRELTGQSECRAWVRKGAPLDLALVNDELDPPSWYGNMEGTPQSAFLIGQLKLSRLLPMGSTYEWRDRESLREVVLQPATRRAPAADRPGAVRAD